MQFRTSGAWGAGKGANLSAVEVDANFYELLQAVEEVQANAPAGVGIENITATGALLTIHLTDGTSKTLTVPVVRLTWRGLWAAGQAYAVNDVVRAAGWGVYIVKTAHVAAGSFAETAAVELMVPEVVDRPAPVVAFADDGAEALIITLDDPDYAGAYLRADCALEATVIVPDDLLMNFDNGQEIHFRQAGAGALVFEPGAGVTIHGVEFQALKTRGKGAAVTLKKVAANEWDLFGALADL